MAKLKIILIMVTGFLASCASLNKEQCENPDWERIGEVDASHGIEAQYEQHLRQCQRSANKAEEQAYLNGWNRKIGGFCTAKNGYESGVFGWGGNMACDTKEYPDFHEQFKLGRKVRDLKSDQAKINTEIEKRQEDPGFFPRAFRAFSVVSGKDPDQDLKNERKEIGQKISLLEDSASGSSDAFSGLSYYQKHSGGPDFNYVGAFIGTFAGFGIGHALQGRYMDDGWKWTLGELATLGTMVATAEDCSYQKEPATGQVVYQCNKQNPWALIGWLGFRVWQGYDLWHYARTQNIYAMPTKDGLLIGFSF